MPSRQRLSLAEARRVAIAAQGLARPRPAGRVTRRHLTKAMAEMSVIQIDSINVIARSQDLVLFSRLGDHPSDLIPQATSAGSLFEYWVHEASHARTIDHPLYRWRMQRPRMWASQQRLQRDRPGLIDEVETIVAERGPLIASELGLRDRPKEQWWDWDDGKAALEILFSTGRISATRRQSDFARVYDLTERVIPPDVLALPTPPENEARKRLLVAAASALGVGTVGDMADYHRQKPTAVRPLVAELVEDGLLVPLAVEGWSEPGYARPDQVVPRRVSARALLSPFDPIVWNRPRAERLFDFHYRIEVYTPKAKRRYGYYVMPFLDGDRLVARADLKADRKTGVLRVHAAWAEPGVDPSTVIEPLRSEVDEMADWLALGAVVHGGGGDVVW